ncbi:hypothetical protein SASPL_115464 [Salvia splendens]|uniref:Uncharacterized protein n=1 Tax=Salvia splendens TaxID=180675 RepID=A0A8X8Y8E3_SALSN|nr:hypothetical protein SASPL_115464 [Salvia splendens]
MASGIYKALEEVANQLPDNSKLKEAAFKHWTMSPEQVSDVKQDIEELESIVEPIVDKIIHGKHTKISREQNPKL